jgi:transcriptional regulator with XRE-family HTH domain
VIEPELGSKLRALRLKRGHSLADVAKATGLSSSFISLVENGKSDLTMGRLVRLLQFYGVWFEEVFEDRPQADPIVVRKDEQRHLYSRGEHLDVSLLSPQTSHTMLPLLAVHAPGNEWVESGLHGGEEWLYVVEGKLELELEGHEPIVLEAGDAAYYRGDRPRRSRNPGKKPTRVVACVSPPHW